MFVYLIDDLKENYEYYLIVMSPSRAGSSHSSNSRIFSSARDFFLSARKSKIGKNELEFRLGKILGRNTMRMFSSKRGTNIVSDLPSLTIQPVCEWVERRKLQSRFDKNAFSLILLLHWVFAFSNKDLWCACAHGSLNWVEFSYKIYYLPFFVH